MSEPHTDIYQQCRSPHHHRASGTHRDELRNGTVVLGEDEDQSIAPLHHHGRQIRTRRERVHLLLWPQVTGQTHQVRRESPGPTSPLTYDDNGPNGRRVRAYEGVVKQSERGQLLDGGVVRLQLIGEKRTRVREEEVRE